MNCWIAQMLVLRSRNRPTMRGWVLQTAGTSLLCALAQTTPAVSDKGVQVLRSADGDRYAHKGFLNRLPPNPSECHGVEGKSCEVRHPGSRRQRSVASGQAGRE